MKNESTQVNEVVNQYSISKETLKRINSLNHYSKEQFINDCKQWIESIRTNKTICIIDSVSSSGMSRCFKYISYVPSNTRSYFRSWYCLLYSLGYTFKKDTHSIRVGGCGMDMNFATTYNIIHSFERMGLITKQECEKLAQLTPSVQ